MQLINPKTWMMALAVVSVFATPGPGQGLRVTLLAVIFLAISLPCLGCWALLGRGAARLFTSARAMKRFNQAMAVLLLASAWLGAPLQGA